MKGPQLCSVVNILILEQLHLIEKAQFVKGRGILYIMKVHTLINKNNALTKKFRGAKPVRSEHGRNPPPRREAGKTAPGQACHFS